MTSSVTGAQEYYKEYWADEESVRNQRGYYEKLYNHLKHRIRISPETSVLDVAGGNGQLAAFLGVKSADVLDISESGLEACRQKGYRTLFGNIEERFPVAENSYDAVLMFEVLEHLHRPLLTLTEGYRALKEKGLLYIGQPNMRADGVHHVRRYYPSELLQDLEKTGFSIKWADATPAYSMRDAIISDIQNNPSWKRKMIQCVNLCLSCLPFSVRHRLALLWPDRFALIYVVCAEKKVPA